MRHVACSDYRPEGSSILEVARDVQALPLAQQLRSIQQEVGASPIDIAGDYMRLAFGQGRISFLDYVKLRLFDKSFHSGAALDSYVGQRRNRDICVTANYRHDWLGLLSNKMASIGYLGAYGLPTIPVAAVYAPQLAVDKPSVLRDRAAIEHFLMSSLPYPLFGKPNESMQSLGSIGIKRASAAHRTLERMDGSSVSLDRVLSEIETHYATGYLFQPFMFPEARIAALCGDRLACVRVVTALTEYGPQVLRTVLKIPSGQNSADNYWRPGNLLAQIELQSGRILRATSGTGFETRHLLTHPDTNEPLIGFAIPKWQSVLALAVEGARLMRHVPLIGWDIACTDQGPVIVEMNETPDFFLVQFADRRGMRDPEFNAFLAFQARNAARHSSYMKKAIAKL